jgi:hypothetical protein
MTRLAGAVVVLIAMLTLAGCSGSPPRSPAPNPTITMTDEQPVANHAASWLFTKGALDSVIANPVAEARLTGAHVYEILSGRQKASTAVPVIPTVSFKSYATLAATIESGQLPSSIRAVIYDNEHWSKTPPEEQADPAGFYAKAAGVAHAHGLIFIATPAMDLVLSSGAKVTNAADTFLASGIIGASARDADVVDIQAQSQERDPAAYKDFVTKAAAQIKAANPKAAIMAGISTNPHGWTITPDMLIADITAVADVAPGFWVNIPMGGTECPDCATPKPDVAIGALSDGRLSTLHALFSK